MQPAYLHRPDSAIAPMSAALPDTALMRFGISVGNASVLLPIGIAAEYMADPEIFPVPRAPSALVGMIQLRGAPVAVFAGGVKYVPSAGGGRGASKIGVLVLGNQGQHGALLVNQPPISVQLPTDATGKGLLKGASAHEAVGVAPWVVRAIRFSVADLSSRHWWELDMAEFMKGLTESGLPRSSFPDPTLNQALADTPIFNTVH
jgi:hypothetical protein